VTLIEEFFPQVDSAVWRLAEKSSLQTAAFSFRARRHGDRRHIELDAPGFRHTAFFDRMTISPVGLELTRLHLLNVILDIPVWRLTPDPVEDRVDRILPENWTFGTIRGPYSGVTTHKEIVDHQIPGQEIAGRCWTVALKISGIGGDVFSARMSFATETGLCHYSGQFFGVFFAYSREDSTCAGCPAEE
jgi:hypothetical protein